MMFRKVSCFLCLACAFSSAFVPIRRNPKSSLPGLKGYLDDLGQASSSITSPASSGHANGGDSNVLLTSQRLSLATAAEIASYAVETMKANAFSPVAAVVVDASGHVICSMRMDGAPSSTLTMATAKANTCIQFGISSRAYMNKYLSPTTTPDVYVRLVSQMMILDGTTACFQGGILLRENETNQIVGAVGVSGAAGDEDEYGAIQGVLRSQAGTLVTTEPPQHSCTTIKV